MTDSTKQILADGVQPQKELLAKDAEVLESNGNIFSDMGMPDAEERLAKAELSLRIEDLIQAMGLTQARAAKIMGLTQPNVSDIVRGRLKGFTLDRLFACLNALDQDIEIVVRPKRDGSRRGNVVVLIK